MEVKITVNKNTLIAAPAGEIDHHSAAAVRKQIYDAYEESRCTDIVFDMNRVEFMDSSGIGLVIGRFKSMQEINGKIIVQNPPYHIKKVMKLAGIDKIAKITNNLE